MHLSIIYQLGKNSYLTPSPAPAMLMVGRVELAPGMAKPETTQPRGYFQISFSSLWLMSSWTTMSGLQKSLIREGWRVNQRNHLLSPLSGAVAQLKVTWSSLYCQFYKPYPSLSGWIMAVHSSYWQEEKLFRSLQHRHLLQLSHASAFPCGFFHAGWTDQCCPLQWTGFSGKHSYSFQPSHAFPKGYVDEK